jgi:hypothetical protein
MATNENTLRSRRCEATNGHRVYEIGNASARFILKAGEILADKFGFEPIAIPIFGADVVLTTCTKAGVTIQLAWDNWCGFCVMSDSPDGDLIVERFGDYVDTILDDPVTQEFRYESA